MPRDIGFLDLSLQHDFPDLYLFHDANTFCDRIKHCRSEFLGADILELLPRCLRGEALIWFRSQSEFLDIAMCSIAMRARFPQRAQQLAPQEAPQASPQKVPQPMESACQAPEYHHCKLCNASFSSLTRLMQHVQENICNKPRCRRCEIVFLSKNQLHQHLRGKCPRQMHTRQRASSSASLPASSPRSSPACLPTCSRPCLSAPSPTPRTPPPAALPEENRVLPSISPSPSPPPIYRMLSPQPPIYKVTKDYLTIEDLYARYAPRDLKIDDLFHMFGGPLATTKSSTITITIDDPFVRPFVLKKSRGSTQIWELGMATSHHQNLRAQCFSPRIATDHRCRPLLLNTAKRRAMPISA